MEKIFSTAKVERAKEPWLKPVDSLVLLYQVLISAVVVTVDIPPEEKTSLLGFHGLFALGVIVILWNFRNFSNPVIQLIREFLSADDDIFFLPGNWIVGP